ncbi:aspartate/glutamate racemase family protein [Sedimentitalea sp. CY04]|uniref:Aspartate/glutamate racemase family protein n=1 Tax=Parasedimentitalea denitrificans TaxID=2211118 RepID=A0ABX0W1N8_9RHOB|nr:aspartate/glutamate racemase family protein [Sedimentitalea sp. CY04]NIZ59544.1 aspartate/glutamate racemase family protein [Sedimentitalea sp. CY04]
MHIGLIGGIGVAATVVYYQRLTAAVDRRGGKLDLTISHGDIQPLIRNNLADDRQPQADIFGRQIDRLRDAGCDCVALTSLGAHYCVNEMNELSSLPVVSGVAPLDEYFVSQGVKRVGLLGTRSVMITRLFGQLKQTETVALDDEIDTLGQSYQDIAVAGTCSDEQRTQMLDAGRRMIAHHDAQAVVLAGTDLNLAFDNQSPEYTVIDALDVHVSVLADLATGRRNLDEVAMSK